MFVSSDDRNLLLLIAPELRLAPLHALHDTSFSIMIVVRLCVRPSVRPSVTGGQRKRFDPEKQEAVSLAIERQKLELGNPCDRQPWH